MWIGCDMTGNITGLVMRTWRASAGTDILPMAHIISRRIFPTMWRLALVPPASLPYFSLQQRQRSTFLDMPATR
jgi:hypothetical protein